MPGLRFKGRGLRGILALARLHRTAGFFDDHTGIDARKTSETIQDGLFSQRLSDLKEGPQNEMLGILFETKIKATR